MTQKVNELNLWRKSQVGKCTSNSQIEDVSWFVELPGCCFIFSVSSLLETQKRDYLMLLIKKNIKECKKQLTNTI